jgi:hypothetical protein
VDQLRLVVASPRIAGSGNDCIGSFMLDRVITSGVGLSLRKTYVGKHDVTYDGEGRMWGTRKCGPDSGRWMIPMRRGGEEAHDVDDVVEIGPKRRG